MVYGKGKDRFFKCRVLLGALSIESTFCFILEAKFVACCLFYDMIYRNATAVNYNFIARSFW